MGLSVFFRGLEMGHLSGPPPPQAVKQPLFHSLPSTQEVNEIVVVLGGLWGFGTGAILEFRYVGECISDDRSREDGLSVGISRVGFEFRVRVGSAE